MRMKLSKSQWEHIGKKAGWLNLDSSNQAYVEIELNKSTVSKRVPLPYGIDKTDSDKLKQYVKRYFSDMGYEVGNIKVL
jgi:hypothetical protein